jgi:hypothetical protein
MAAILLLLLLLPTPDAGPVEVGPQYQASSLSRAVFAGGRVWLMSDTGGLSSVAEGNGERVVESLPEPARDLCVRDGHPAVITSAEKEPSTWTLRERRDGKWVAVNTVPIQFERLVAVSCRSDGFTLLTSARLIEVHDGPEKAVELSEGINARAVTSILVTLDHVFVGINAGEWGGGLRRIVRRTGKVESVEHNASGELCGGPLNASCDPVNGIVSDPWKPGCVVAAVGLVHFSPHGRLVEVCGNKVRRLFVRRYGPRPPHERGTRGDEPSSTVAFFGLLRDNDEIWAVGIDGVYRLGADGAARSQPLPRFNQIGGIGVSFAVPRIVLVLTSVNQRRSISGSTPMLVPR